MKSEQTKHPHEYNYRGLLFSIYNDVSGKKNLWYAEALLQYRTENRVANLPDVKSKTLTTPAFIHLNDAIDVMENLIDDFIKQYF